MRKIFILGLATVATGSAFAQNLYSNQSSDVNVAALNASATTRSGVAAGAGARWSEVQANGGGVQTGSNTVAGFSVFQNAAATSNFRMADDFTVTGPSWNVTGFKTYAYTTGSAATANIFTGGSLNIWSAAPNASGAVIIGTATFSGQSNNIAWQGGGSGLVHRIFNTNSPAPGTAPGTTRIIREISWTTSINLAAGTYWIDWQGTTGTTSAFGPSTTHQDSRGVAGANALQANAGVWTSLIDAGNPATEPDVAQEVPFIVTGTAVPEPATMAILGAGALALIRRRRSK